MNQSIKILGIALSAFLVGAVANNFAFSTAIPNYKVAIVDVQKVVASSKQVNLLKEEQKSKIKDLANFVEKAKTTVAAEKDPAKKKDLEDQFNAELNTRKSTIDKDYAQKLTVIDNNISSVISQKAKENNYDLILSKGVVLFGGDDITSVISQSVK